MPIVSADDKMNGNDKKMVKIKGESNDFMRVAMYVITLLTVGGLAGLYQQDSLMVLFIAGIFLLVLLFAYSFYLRGRVLVEFAETADTMVKGEFFPGTIKLINPTCLPVIYLRVWMEWENRMTGQKGKEIFQGTCPSCADTELEVIWEAQNCGEVYFTLTKVETCDIFRLFKLRSRTEKTTSLLVLPVSEEFGWSFAAPSKGEDMGPYRQGDRVKHIHWKLSARMDELLVRHEHRFFLPEALFYLELKVWPESEPEKAEAFLKKLATILAMLVGEGWIVRVLWNSSYLETAKEEEKSRKQEWSECCVKTKQDYPEVMGRIMEELERGRKNLPKKKGRFGAVLDLYEKNEEKGQGQLLQEEEEVMFCLDFEGRFYLNHQLVDLEEME